MSFCRYVYGLFRVGESEVQNKEKPFPKVHVPYLTIYQLKGLEFLCVILGNTGEKIEGFHEQKKLLDP